MVEFERNPIGKIQSYLFLSFSDIVQILTSNNGINQYQSITIYVVAGCN